MLKITANKQSNVQKTQTEYLQKETSNTRVYNSTVRE